ncbi:Protein msta, isoform A [Armadillidium nasatum]|uniref:Protein msta, isoform A n=1 Tax=Armadillidium nasatum TaxID=96803 RepID=A0A5N5TEJ0_9CRUS|nr:Protein msta, isoform A [Armadillidium nasatum]
MINEVGNPCANCGKPAKQFCSSCKSVFYCSKDCQKKGWKSHKPHCRPFIVQTHPVYGRYAIATRDIKPGEVVLREPPIVYGPKQCTVPICLGCHKRISDPRLCKRCKYPVCSPECENIKHHQDECVVLAKASSPLTFSDFDKVNPSYECITPLRCLLLKKSDPKKWETFLDLQSHIEDIQDTELFKVNQRNIVDFIRIFLEYEDGIEKSDDVDILHRICGILSTNCFELLDNSQRIRGIYYSAAMLAHNCSPNTKHSFDSNKNIIFRATQGIQKGKPLFATYSHTLWDTHSRRKLLKTFKFFYCTCKRCSDPTELGTNLSTLICSKCSGEIKSTDPLDQNALWKCSKCDHQLLAKQIKWGNDMLNEELRSLGKLDPRTMESFIKRYRKALHKNHRFNVEAKYALVKLYGNSPNYYYKDLEREQIENKVKWCRELLCLAEKIDPGKSLLRGTLLFELQAGIVAQAKILLSNDLITQEKAADYMNEAVGYLQEASEILKHEPEMEAGGLDEKLKWLSKELEI